MPTHSRTRDVPQPNRAQIGSRLRRAWNRTGLGRAQRATAPYVGRRFQVLLVLVGVAGAVIGVTEAVILRVIGELAASIEGSGAGAGASGYSIGPFDGISLGWLVTAGAGATVFLIALRAMETALVTGVGILPLTAVRKRLAHSFIAADFATQQAVSAGEFQEMVKAHTMRVGSIATAAAMLVSAVFMTIALAVVAAVVNLPALVALAGVMVLVLVVLLPIQRLANVLGRSEVAANTALANRTAEMVQAATDARVFGVSDSLLRDNDEQVDRVSSIIVRSHAAAFFGGSAFYSLMLGVIVLLGGLLAARTTQDFAAAGTVALIALRAQMAGRQALSANLSIATSSPFADELEERIALLQATTEPDGDETLDAIDSVELSSLSYRHPLDERSDVGTDGGWVLRGLELAIARGEHVGIVGPSGSGKTTLNAILLGLRTPVSGTITFNGQDRSHYTAASLSRQIAGVAQRPTLITASVADNIRFFRGLSDDEVRAAARAAGVYDEITSWPNGFETIIGERGARQVSGGQAQRICIARALAGGPSLLVMDEPTSAIDEAGSRLIADTMAALGRSCAAVIVSHRAEALGSCDRVLEMVDGRLVELRRRSSA